MKQLDSFRKLHKKLGVGARGVVYLGFNDDTGAFVAIKEVSFVEPTRLSDDGTPPRDHHQQQQQPVDEAAQVLRELRVMQQVRHERLVGYLGARRSLAGVEIIMEYVGGGSLERLLRQAGPLRETVARRYVRDVLEGLHYLHDTVRVCHRDIKPGNILLTPDGRCKLTDFGASAMLSGGESFMQTTVGTPWYMAPEVIHNGGGEDDDDSGRLLGDGHDDTDDGYYNPLKKVEYHGGTRSPLCRSGGNGNSGSGGGYTTGADIWSLGVTLYEMLSGEKPFGGQLRNTAAVMFAILQTATTPPTLPSRCVVSAELQSFLQLCLVYDPKLRPTARELLQHPWVAESRPSTGTGTGTTTTTTTAAETLSLRPPPPLPPRAQGSTSASAAAAEYISSGSSREAGPLLHSGGGGGGTRSSSNTSPLTPSHRSEDSDDAASVYEQVRRRIEAKDTQAQRQQQKQQPPQQNTVSTAAQILQRYNTNTATRGSGTRGKTSKSTTRAGKGLWSLDGHYVDLPDDDGGRLPY